MESLQECLITLSRPIVYIFRFSIDEKRLIKESNINESHANILRNELMLTMENISKNTNEHEEWNIFLYHPVFMSYATHFRREI